MIIDKPMKFRDIESQPSKYYKTKQGQNRFRIVSEAIPVWTAFDRANKTVRKYLEATQAAGDKEAKLRYAMWVIDRTDNAFRVAEFGASIVSQIQELAISQQYGFDDIPKYDMTVTRKGDGLDTEYTLIPDRADTPLTMEENAYILGLEDLTEFFRKEMLAAVKGNEAKTSEPPF
jgi:hypothetical protein